MKTKYILDLTEEEWKKKVIECYKNNINARIPYLDKKEKEK